jgi:hypothetical protein
MSITGGGLVLLGLVLVILSLRSGVRSTIGNFVGGNVRGNVVQNFTQSGQPPAPAGGHDYVGWMIRIAGVLVAVWGIYLDHPDAFHR